jgi:hypothetical protein
MMKRKSKKNLGKKRGKKKKTYYFHQLRVRCFQASSQTPKLNVKSLTYCKKRKGGNIDLCKGTMKHTRKMKQHRVKRYLRKGTMKHKRATKHQGATKQEGIVMHCEAMKP